MLASLAHAIVWPLANWLIYEVGDFYALRLPVLPALSSYLFLLVGMILALRVIKVPWLGLCIGAAAGGIAHIVAMSLMGFWYLEAGLLSLLSLLQAVVFAGVFWGALQLFPTVKS